MPDPNEIEALKASLRGAHQAAADLDGIGATVAALPPETEIGGTDLDALQRLSLANAVAAEALRGLVEMMLRRRGRAQDLVATGASAADDER